mmetsp:Transcript_65413/g.108728  ORF Transcript_65413/g.108728 Transcript_65413/m.108728 type:complete len:85 (-) Transcript_65413:448-702(-)
MTTSSAINESKPEVGSSRKTIGGRVISARPMFVRLSCPPDMPLTRAPPITVLRHDASRSAEMTSSTRCFFSCLVCVGSLSSAVY